MQRLTPKDRMYLSAVERGDSKTFLEMVKAEARSAKIWQAPRKTDICEEVFPADTWGDEFLQEISSCLDGDEVLGPTVVVHWEDIKPWKNVASSGSLHTSGQIKDMTEALLSSGNLPPVLRRWRGSHGEDAVDYQEEPGDFPYFVDGKHRIQAALRAGIPRVPVIDLLQFESPAVDIITRNDNGDVIPLSERFGTHRPGAHNVGPKEDTMQSIVNKMQFKNECTGSCHGQKDMELGLWVDNGTGFEAKGFISYSVSESGDDPTIHWVEVVPADRRKGYATKMVLELQKKYPDTQINWGIFTSEGARLYSSLPQKKVDIPDIVDAQQRLRAVKKKLAAYQNRYEFFSKKSCRDIEETRQFLNVVRKWNALHDLENDLSIYENMSCHKIIIDETKTKETESICIWPDGMVCRQEDLESYQWAGDDFAQVELPLDKDMHEFAQKFIEKQTNNYSPRPR